MMLTLPLNSATSLLKWSNIVYVSGAILTLGAAGLVLYEKRAVTLGMRSESSLRAEILVLVAAFVSVLGTLGAIYFSSQVSKIKDIELAIYERQADASIKQAQAATARANQVAAEADQRAQEARLKADDAENKNAKLRDTVAKQEAEDIRGQAALAKQASQNQQFTHALALQQETMAQQMHVSPEMNQQQVQEMGASLSTFAGQNVIVHCTDDTTVERLANSIVRALNIAHIKHLKFSIDMGALYQGVTVAVHAARGRPPLADALVVRLRSFGIAVKTASVPQRVPQGAVAIFLGPN